MLRRIAVLTANKLFRVILFFFFKLLKTSKNKESSYTGTVKDNSGDGRNS